MPCQIRMRNAAHFFLLQSLQFSEWFYDSVFIRKNTNQYRFNEHRQLFFELFWDSGQFLVEFEVKILNIWRKKPIDRKNVIEFLISFELKKNSHMKYCSVKKNCKTNRMMDDGSSKKPLSPDDREKWFNTILVQ